MDKDHHEATESPLEERVMYAKVVAMMAAADADVDDRELDRLDELCELLALPAAERSGVLAAAQAAAEVDVASALSVVRGSDLRFTLYTDCLLVAFADQQVVPAEEAQLGELAEALDISTTQQHALRRFVEVLSAGEDEMKARADEVRLTLTEAEIPVRSLGYVSAAGLSVIGSTVGLGVLAAAIGIPTGIGALIGVGVGTMVGVRWLYKQLDREG
jgi:uncharacterized tellurite resistance protein B-like protein